MTPKRHGETLLSRQGWKHRAIRFPGMKTVAVGTR